MATATCLLSSVRCSTNDHPNISVKVGDLKTALSSFIKPSIQKLENSTLRIEAGKAIKNASSAMLNSLVDSIFQFVDQPMLPSEYVGDKLVRRHSISSLPMDFRIQSIDLWKFGYESHFKQILDRFVFASDQKNFAPVEEIGELVKIDNCQGKIPKNFPEGIYVRNGSNPLFGGLKYAKSVFGKTDSIWIEGEGMLHALHFTKDEEGNWSFYYKNRYVETETYKMESKRKKPAFLPVVDGDPPAALAASFLNVLRFGHVNKIMSNTNVFEHGGKHYSIAENYMPQEINLISLETYGNWNPSGIWSRPFTSHPKKAPGTGELVTVGFEPTKPYCVVGVISADGKELVHKLDLQLDHCSLFHEVGVTKKYNILIDSMFTLSPERVMKGGQLFKYERERDARIGVIPRYGDADSIKWFHIEPCVTYHILNTFEDGDEVVVRGCKANDSILPGPDWGENKFDWFSRGFNFKNVNDHKETRDGMLFTSVREWRLNMETMEVKERDVTGSEYSMDFPMINADYTGLKHHYGYTQVIDSLASSKAGRTIYGGLAKLSFEEVEKHSTHGKGSVKIEYHWLPKNNFCSGSAFVAKREAIEEDDGWIITFAHDEDNDISYVLVVDTNNFEHDPIAKIELPQRVPYGFHGSFFSST